MNRQNPKRPPYQKSDLFQAQLVAVRLIAGMQPTTALNGHTQIFIHWNDFLVVNFRECLGEQGLVNVGIQHHPSIGI